MEGRQARKGEAAGSCGKGGSLGWVCVRLVHQKERGWLRGRGKPAAQERGCSRFHCWYKGRSCCGAREAGSQPAAQAGGRGPQKMPARIMMVPAAATAADRAAAAACWLSTARVPSLQTPSRSCRAGQRSGVGECVVRALLRQEGTRFLSALPQAQPQARQERAQHTRPASGWHPASPHSPSV